MTIDFYRNASKIRSQTDCVKSIKKTFVACSLNLYLSSGLDVLWLNTLSSAELQQELYVTIYIPYLWDAYRISQ